MATLTGGALTLTGGALGDTSQLQATEDALFGGSVVLFQPRRGAGYRTNVDALILAAFAAAIPSAEDEGREGARRPASLAYDLGAGVGAVGLALLRFGAARHVVFVEIDEVPAAMARRNLDANGWTSRGEVICGDVREVGRARSGQAALVVCNPPYVAPGRGRVSPAEARARMGDLGTFVEAARQVAGRRARVCFVYPAYELGALLGALATEGLHAKRLRFVHPSANAPARIALVEARAGRPGGLAVHAPLIEREGPRYTREMEMILSSDDAAGA